MAVTSSTVCSQAMVAIGVIKFARLRVLITTKLLLLVATGQMFVQKRVSLHLSFTHNTLHITGCNMYAIKAVSHYVQFVLKTVSVSGFPKYTRMYTFNLALITTFATREECQKMIDEYDPKPDACLPWRVYKLDDHEIKQLELH
ncbi:hypothetical protein VPHD480_0325 [Vibrio phage D480]